MPRTASSSWLSASTALNLRDVGGLACRDGESTRRLVLLRSGSLRLLTAPDAEVLRSTYGVRTVVDLRSAREVALDGPSALARAGVATAHLPLAPEDRAGLPESTDNGDPANALRRAYHSYLDERGHHIALAARLVATSPAATLVHCAAGKDRTGVTVAMILDAVGVQRSAVVADYVATNEVIEQVVRSLATAYGYQSRITSVDLDAHRARPAVLSDLLERVDAEFGGAAAWLRWNGLSEQELAALRHRLVRPVARTSVGSAE